MNIVLDATEMRGFILRRRNGSNDQVPNQDFLDLAWSFSRRHSPVPGKKKQSPRRVCDADRVVGHG